MRLFFHVKSFLPAMVLFSVVVSTTPGALAAATFTVNSTADLVDVNVGDGICDADAGAPVVCTLRAAIMQANALPGTDVINLPANTFELTLASGGDDERWGDLDVLDFLVIEGTEGAVIDGSDTYRIFEVAATGNLTLRRVDLRSGSSDFGGCLRSYADVQLDRVEMYWCFASSAGGAIFSNGPTARLFIDDSWLHENTTNGTGGGISSFDFTRIERTSFTQNIAFRGGALVANDHTVIINSTFAGNQAAETGGAIWHSATGQMYNSTLVSNRCDTSNNGHRGGGLFHGGSTSAPRWRVSHTVVADNVCGPLGALVPSDCTGNDPFYDSLGYNFIGIGTGCSGFAGAGDTVGPTLPLDPGLEIAPETAGGFGPSYAPTPSSPLLNAGDPAGCIFDRDGSGPLPTLFLTDDQRLKSRPGWICDIGAVEAGLFSDDFESGNVSLWSSAAGMF